MGNSSAHRPGHVLVVEDDDDIRNAVAEVLEEAGFVTSLATHGAEALESLRSGKVPDLILLYLMMPVMDGFEFRANQAREEAWANIPVVVMSADGNIAVKKERAGSAAYLRKPLDIYELVAVVERLISETRDPSKKP